MDHAYGREAPYTLGVEEELILVDADTHELAHECSDIFERLGESPPGEIKHDTYEAMVELATPVCSTAAEAVEHLAALRTTMRDAGATLIGCGIHPDGDFGDVVHVPEPRYREVLDLTRGLLKRTPTGAVHIHVGMPDPETAILACNRLRAYLPLFQALAAHSPFWHGVDSGLASARAQMWRGYRSAIVTPELAGWDGFVAAAQAAVEAGDLADYTYLWWDVRPHPRLGTIELRAMDAQASLHSVHGLAALVHALAIGCAHEPLPGELPTTEAIGESSFRAARDGLEATLYWDGALRPLGEIAAIALDAARAYSPDPDSLEEVERILRKGNGADRMRAWFARGRMPAVLSGLVAEASLWRPVIGRR